MIKTNRYFQILVITSLGFDLSMFFAFENKIHIDSNHQMHETHNETENKRILPIKILKPKLKRFAKNHLRHFTHLERNLILVSQTYFPCAQEISLGSATPNKRFSFTSLITAQTAPKSLSKCPFRYTLYPLACKESDTLL